MSVPESSPAQNQNVLQHCPVFFLMFWWSIQSEVCGRSSEGRSNELLAGSPDEKNWGGFPLGRSLESSPDFIRIFMVKAFGWWRGPWEKAGRLREVHPCEPSSQGAPWAAFVAWCNKSYMCRPFDLLVVWTRPLSSGGGHCAWLEFKGLGLTWWARRIPP